MKLTDAILRTTKTFSNWAGGGGGGGESGVEYTSRMLLTNKNPTIVIVYVLCRMSNMLQVLYSHRSIPSA